MVNGVFIAKLTPYSGQMLTSTLLVRFVSGQLRLLTDASDAGVARDFRLAHGVGRWHLLAWR
jgi:hypothetical protein